MDFIDWKLFGSTFALIFVAELPDKTALASLLMATRNNPLAVFVGAAAAFVIQSLVAVSFGSLFSLLPPKPVHIAAGLLFFLFAVQMWRRRDEGEALEKGTEQVLAPSFLKVAGASFVVIFIAEWGDLTQLATAALAAQSHAPLTLFAASTLALWSVTALGVLVGHHAKRWINPAQLQRFAAVAFAGAGFYLILSALLS